jgi:hypothetical protein
MKTLKDGRVLLTRHQAEHLGSVLSAAITLVDVLEAEQNTQDDCAEVHLLTALKALHELGVNPQTLGTKPAASPAPAA